MSSTLASMPKNVFRLGSEDSFEFSCHKGVSCFTECCRLLELILTPYDVLRLRRGTGLNSREVLDRYVIEEWEEGDIFPRFYLTMVDDGRASCVFVNDEGCTIYEARPGPCRAYPLGRAAIRKRNGEIDEHFVLMKEDHCKGFSEKTSQTPLSYSEDQGLKDYNHFNDAMAPLVQSDELRQGLFMPSKEQRELFTLALYDIDTFRSQLINGDHKVEEDNLPDFNQCSDEELLLFSINWLISQFYTK